MLTYASGILLAKLSFTLLQPRLVSLPWLRRNPVRCFSQKADVSGVPVRYVPKKRPDVNPTRHSVPGDIFPEDGMAIRSSSSAFQRKRSGQFKSADGDSKKSELLNASIDFNHELNTEDEDEDEFCSKEVTDKVDEKVHLVAVNFGEATKEGARESLNSKWGGQGKVREFKQDMSYDRLVDEKYVIPEAVIDVKAAQGSGKSIISSGGDLTQCRKVKQQMSHDGLVDEEYMEASETVEETQLHYGSGNGKFDRTKQDAGKVAIELLAKRAYTAVELRKKLIAKHFPVNIVEAVVHDFKHRELINDGLYAETYSQSRWKSSSWGPRRIKQALAKKGVSEVHMEKAVKLVFEDPEEGGQGSSIRLSSSSLHQLYTQAYKQWQRSLNAAHETRKVRVIRWLQYRGFDWGVIGIIMKKLESEHCP